MDRYLILVLLHIASCQIPNKSNARWQNVFHNDANKNTIFGDKSKLLEAERLGYPIRIGWG